ncbi:uncharacterized protein LOC131613172 [Vicia villosa]|uniref:uncharacterized protein LOC131613172 n=1 Tax=Vicia villosa TaxID=3911 RepID=UPI00273CA974|nr:uncharacterized protein LOC131613172 [Vicia villosa]
MDKVYTHWKKLRFNDLKILKDNSLDITIETKLEVIMEIFSKVDDTMKLHIKEQLRRIAYPETTDLKPPSQSVKTKGAPKKVKSTQDDTSTKMTPSYHEVVDELFPDSSAPNSETSVFKRARTFKPPQTPPVVKPSAMPSIKRTIRPLIIYIDEMSLFMHQHIEKIIDVGSDGNCGYRSVAALIGKGEKNYTLVRHALISELIRHKDTYKNNYPNKGEFEKVHSLLVPCISQSVPLDKWMSFPEMGHLIAGT